MANGNGTKLYDSLNGPWGKGEGDVSREERKYIAERRLILEREGLTLSMAQKGMESCYLEKIYNRNASSAFGFQPRRRQK